MTETLHKDREPPFVHPTSEVHERAVIGFGTKIWNWVQVREDAVVGDECTLSKGVYIDRGVVIGNRVKIQNNVSVYEGVTLESGVFVGPHVVFTNDVNPRAITPGGEVAGADDWEITPTLVEYGASLGAGAVIRAGVTIGRWALIGAGAVVVKDIPAYGLALGNPAAVVGRVDEHGRVVERYSVS